MPEAAKQPPNIFDPPPCLTVGTVYFSLKASFLFFWTVPWCPLHNCFSQIHRQLFTLLLHAQCDTQHKGWVNFFSILTGCKCDYYIAHTCYLPQVCLNTNFSSITCLKSNCLMILTRCSVVCTATTTSTWIPKHLQLEQNVAFSDSIAYFWPWLYSCAFSWGLKTINIQ